MNVAHESLDLNLLVLLDALLAEGSATKAASRLGVTQSAASHGLKRLREALGDPLLVRTGRGLVPTPRAEALRGPIREALGLVDRALAPARFDPATSRERFVLMAPDYVGVLLLPTVVARLATEAPGVALQVRAPTPDPHGALAAEVDVALGATGPDADGIWQLRLWDDGFSTALRAGHPRAADPWDLDLYCDLGHVLTAPRGVPGGTVDPVLDALGRRRKVVVQVAQFVAAAHVAAATDLVLTLPTRLAERICAGLDLDLRRPPLELPRFSIVAQWHVRRQADPAHRWFRSLLAEVARNA